MKGLVIGLVASVLVVAALLFGTYISANNDDRQLRNLAEAQRDLIEAQYDNMWKVLQQKAKVTNEYKSSFKEIFVGIIEGRYDNDSNTLMKWIKESNPEFDASLYKDLMASIEIKRTEFLNVQKRMIDIIREHNDLLSVAPKCWFVSNKTKIEYTVISSTRTKQVMDTGMDDDVELFN